MRALLAEGQDVSVWVRDEAKARELFGQDVTVYKGSFNDRRSLDRAMRGVATLYHVAGLYRFGRRNKAALFKINVDGTEQVMASAYEAGVAKVVHVSTAGILVTNETHPHENSFPKVIPLDRPYKASKWLAETHVLQWAQKGLPVVIACPTCPLGVDDTTPTGQIIRDFLNGKFLFSCRTGLNFSDCRDLALGLMACAKYGRIGERYVLGHHNMMLTDFLKLLAFKTSLPAPLLEVPRPLILAGALGTEFLQQIGLIQSDTRLSWETAQQSQYLQYFDSAKAEKELFWKPQTQLSDTVDWVLESYSNKKVAKQSLVCCR